MRKILCILIAVIGLFGCKEYVKEEKQSASVARKELSNEKKNKVEDKYVYIDAYRCLHLDRNCLCFVFQDENIDRPFYEIHYRQKHNLRDDMFSSFCSQCTDVEDYEKINVLCVKNERRRVYDMLVCHGYECGSNFEEFDSLITECESAREWLYRRSEVRDMINTTTIEERFSQELGIPMDFVKQD